MLTLLPLASGLNPPEHIAAVVGRIGERLTRRQVSHRFVATTDERPDALLIVTGGTEHLALEAIGRRTGPVFLLAHPELNSLPAALEILAHLSQRGRRGRIILLAQAGDGEESLVRFAHHLDVRRRLQGLRLGRIGAPSDWLVASTPASDVVSAAWGPTLVDVPIEEVLDALRGANASEAERIRNEIVAAANAVVEPSPADLDAAARLVVALRQVVGAHRLDACTVRCFDLLAAARTTGCLALSWLHDEGIVAGCEGDVPATLTMLWMQLATNELTFMANPQDLDPQTNTLWLAHCTIARRIVSRYELRSHFESSIGVGIAGHLEPGLATVARVGGADLRSLYVSDAEIVADGDNPQRCRTQVQLRLASNVDELLTAPLGNHHVLARGHWASTLREYHDLFIATH